MNRWKLLFNVAFLASCSIGPERLFAIENSFYENKILEYRVENCPVLQCVQAVYLAGPRVCTEYVFDPIELKKIWVDNLGRFAFAGPAYSLNVNDVYHAELLTKFTKILGGYQWKAVSGTNLVNIRPSTRSLLDKPVGPYRVKGTIYSILKSIPEMTGVEQALIREQLPEADLDFPGGTRRDLLNALALAAGDRWVWTIVVIEDDVRLQWMCSYPAARLDRVRMVYDVHLGPPFEKSSSPEVSPYEPVQVVVNDDVIMVVRRAGEEVKVPLPVSK